MPITSKKTLRMRRERMLILGSAVFAMLLLGAAASYWPAGRAALSESYAPDLDALLPAGVTVEARAELPDTPQSATVAAYAGEGGRALALIVWDKREQRHRLSSTLRLNGAGAPDVVLSITTGSLGLGAPVAAFVHGKSQEAGETVHVFARSGDEIRAVRMTGADGGSGDAAFPEGAVALGAASTSFEDVDGDGDKDALIQERGVDEDGAPSEVFTVYAWRDEGFAHDGELTRLVSLRDSIFPEPEAPPVDGAM